MNDTIYRQEAIDAIYEHEFSNWCDKDEVSTILNDLPSADRPQGEWLNYKDEHTCSVCKEVVIDDWYYDYEWYNYCPNCGCRMKGADDE